jgi:adenosylcobinamide kinase/adenosylcobinamide-phosphate guanylyltransferase
MGVVPATSAGRLFRDELGRLNQALAAESEETELVIAGCVVPLGTW